MNELLGSPGCTAVHCTEALGHFFSFYYLEKASHILLPCDYLNIRTKKIDDLSEL